MIKDFNQWLNEANGMPEDYDAIPGAEEDIKGQRDYADRQEYEKYHDPNNLNKLRQQAKRSTQPKAAAQYLWSMFRQQNPSENPNLAFIKFDAMLDAVTEDFYYPGGSSWSDVELSGIDPEWLRMYEMY